MPIELNPPYWTGGPPYPSYATDEGKFGLSILDWFAGHAVAGLMGSELIDQKFFDQFIFPGEQNDQFITPGEPLPALKKPFSKELLETPEQLPAVPAPPTPEQLAMIAYAIAGQMAEIRERLPIEPKPVPGGEGEEILPQDISIQSPLNAAWEREGVVRVSSTPSQIP